MEYVFVELPAFERHRADYLDDDGFRELQELLMARPDAGVLVPGTGGVGKRGGLRVIYFWWEPGRQVWLFTLYAKGEMSDLTETQRAMLRTAIKSELDARRGG